MGEKLLAIGDAFSLQPLVCLGFEVIECSRLSQLEEILKDLRIEEYALLVITENLIAGKRRELKQLYLQLPLPLIVLPTLTSRRGETRDFIQQVVKETLGAELWKKEE